MVVDASVVIAWILPDERNPATDGLLHEFNGQGGIVPSIFWHEVRNTFLVAEGRGRLKPGEAYVSMLDVRCLGFEDAGHGDDRTILGLAMKHELSAYDAAYLALAISRAVPLATIDKRLAAGARRENVLLKGPLHDGAPEQGP